MKNKKNKIVLGLIYGACWLLTICRLEADIAFLVEQGKGRAVIIVSKTPSPIASYAADELANHIRKATGVELPILSETETATPREPLRVYVGNTAAAKKQGIEPELLKNDEAVIRFIDGHLYIVGKEGEGSPLDRKAGNSRGTLFGVYEFLERYTNVRWLWPGELGTYVPQTDTIKIDTSVDEAIKPSLLFRRARIGHIQRQVQSPDPILTQLGFSHYTARSYLHALDVFLARHRLGDTESKPVVGHHFAGWWKRHGKNHPDWFMLNEEGKRGPKADATETQLHHVAMCVSNPDLHRYIVEEHWNGGDNLSLGEVDVRMFCNCERCLSWDGPQTVGPPDFARADYTPRNVSDRYARFWKTIYEMASKRNPNVTVTSFLYWNYFPAPTGDMKLNKNIYGEYVPWTGPYVYFPMPTEREEWLRAQWLKWKEQGITLAYRPNYLLGGYVFPAISTWQAGEFFKFASENGMVGFDYDSLHGHWSAKGPMLYMHMRLFAKPQASITDIRKEYFEAFGPAAEPVEEYFDYWENRARRSGVQGGNPVDIIGKYPPAAFDEAQIFLNRALNAALQSPNKEYADRVKFLQIGLKHSSLAADLVRSIGRRGASQSLPGAFGDDGFNSTADRPKNAQQLRKAQEALLALIKFRRSHEHLFFADLTSASSREKRTLNIERLLPVPEQ